MINVGPAKLCNINLHFEQHICFVKIPRTLCENMRIGFETKKK